MLKIILFVAPPLLLILALYAWFVIEYSAVSKHTKGTKKPGSDKTKKALLVIDMQKGITGEVDRLGNIDGEVLKKITGNINVLIGKAEERDMEVIYLRMFYRKNTLMNFITKAALEEESAGTQIDSRIELVNNNVFVKYKMDAFSCEKLEQFLESRNIGKLYITGVDATMCVDRTVRGACERGYEVTIVRDAVATSNEKALAKAFEDFNKLPVKLETTASL